MIVSTEFIKETIRSSPPVAVSGLNLFGYPVADSVAVVTLVYVLLQIFFLLKRKIYKEPDDGRDG